MTSLDMFLEQVEDAVERVEVKPLRIAMPASKLKALFTLLRVHSDNFGVFVRNGVLNSAVLSPTHVTCVRLTVDGVFEKPVVEPPLGVLNLENALKALRNIKSDTPLVYDFSQIDGEIRYGDLVVYRESGEGLKVEELVWDIEHDICAEVKISTKELLSLLGIFKNSYDYVRFSYQDGLLKVWDDNMEKVVKAPGCGYLDKQCFSFGYIYESVKGLDKLGCMGVTLSFYIHGSNKPAPMAIKAKIKDISLTIYQAPRIE
ncbi:MAG: hypothetical protein QW318_06825 [Candidatus Caldarchaeum sp.]